MTLMKYDNPAKRFLRGYRALLVRRESLLREVERMRESITGTTVQLKQDVVTTSGASDRMGDTVARIVDAESALSGSLAEIDKHLRDILNAIEAVPDELQKTVLTLRYIEGLDWVEVANKIQYEERQTFVIHGRALVAVNDWLKSAQENAVGNVL